MLPVPVLEIINSTHGMTYASRGESSLVVPHVHLGVLPVPGQMLGVASRGPSWWQQEVPDQAPRHPANYNGHVLHTHTSRPHSHLPEHS